MIRYAATTRDITVTVHPVYLDEPSNLVEHTFHFGYAVRVSNNSTKKIDLLRQRWIVRGADGSLQQPAEDATLRPRPSVAPGDEQTFERTCTLDSFDGIVEGTFLAQRPNGEQFRVSVPSFHLHAAAN